jgi:hypothetical protein
MTANPWVGKRGPKALEERAEVDSLEALQQKRRDLMKEYAPLAGKFKGGATAGTDAARKRHRALVAKRILVELRQRFDAGPQQVPSKKTAGLMVPAVWAEPADVALERMANADTEHIAFCQQLEMDYVRFILLENDIQEINEKIRSREVELYSYNAELRMQS